jgi:predicted GTPase
MSDKDFDADETRAALDELLAMLDRIPGAARFRKDVARLKAILVDRRAPRVVIVGRRGHGKSSLANALMGREALKVGHIGDEPASDAWTKLEADGRVLDWLDTSGLGAGGIAPERLERLKEQVAKAFPDVVLYACKAKEVDSEIDATLEGLKQILKVLSRDGSTAPLIVVVTQADEMHPSRDMTPPYTAPKQAHIAGAKDKLKEHLERHGIEAKAIIPVSAYVEFGAGGQIEWDGRWNIDSLSQKMFQVLPEAATMEAARAFDTARNLRRKVAKSIIAATSSAAFGIGMAPTGIPDIVILAPIQQAMVTAIAYLSGRRMTVRAITEWIVSIGGAGAAGLAVREVFRFLVKMIPVAGNIVSGAMAGAWTWGLGMAALAYFIDDQTLEESKKAFEREKSKGKDWRPPEDGSDGDVESAAK